ncbi:hypothetical protein [Alteribacter aurantiacus]|uniref:hypothetical protein n=1 Tax=Alteribacter aurantiacus TaxID=254410 RepID=UPI000687D666|nr:hypothetical protein [Alteribacter aurantiacus]
MTMRLSTLFFFLSVIFLCIGCQNEQTRADYSLLGNDNEIVTVLFSDENQINQEIHYYDAVLRLQNDHSEKIDKVKVIDAKEEDYTSTYEISTFPTLIIIDNNEVTLRIEGNLDNEQILNEIKTGLNQVELHDVSNLNRS